MNNAADRWAGGVIPDARLPDVSEMSLRAILETGSALGGALARLAWETHSDEIVLAAFSSFASESSAPPTVAV